ncbi:NADP-dependent oxidoreductase domain-containing protein [Gautieria morchelliformis]|nr:NADP-dependent oxidoreductase domain-containing protein [Gautieria morchelliformis]
MGGGDPWRYGSPVSDGTGLKASLGVSYVDLYLIRSPGLLKNNTWAEFEKIKSDGLAKSIGVSDFTIKDLVKLMKTAKVVPAVHQVSFHPCKYVQNASLLEFSAKFNIVTEAYHSVFSMTELPRRSVVKPIQRAAKRLNVTPAQVILSWVRSKGVIIVTFVSLSHGRPYFVTSQSTEKYCLKEYLEVADLSPLTAQEILDIESEGARGPLDGGGGLGICWLTLPLRL